MKIGRNAPCPCGSGKKYKACCLKLDRGNPTPPGGMPIREAASRATSWQVDLMPIPARFDDDPGARPAAVMVTAAGLVIFTEVLARPSAEVDDIATELERAIGKAVENVGALPATLEVREPEVAEVLGERLAAAGSPVPVRAAVLDELEEAIAALNRSMGGSPTPYVATSPDLWEGWGQPAEWIARLFRRGAAYYRAELWKYFDDFPPITAYMPAGHRWYLSVLGSAGEEFGLALHSDADDIDQMLDGSLSSPGGRILAVTFDTPRRLPRAMRKEVARAGWEIASAKAYPFLIAIGTPAGGLRRSDAADLIAVVGAMTAWAEAIEREGESLADEPWQDPQTGIELECQGHPTGETTAYDGLTPVEAITQEREEAARRHRERG